MAEHRITTTEPTTWDHTPSTRQRVTCTCGDLNLKLAGRGVDEVVELIIANHGCGEATR